MRNTVYSVFKIVVFLVVLSIAIFKSTAVIERPVYVKYPIPVYTIKEIHYSYLRRMEVNEEVKLHFDHYLRVYAKITGDMKVAHTILIKALEKEIPVNIAFAISSNESNFNKNAVNKNSNNSFDYGLFQINSYTFPKADHFNVEENVELGLSYYKKLYKMTGSYEVSFTFYNAGPYRNYVPYVSVLYISRVLTKEYEFDKIFNENRYIYDIHEFYE